MPAQFRADIEYIRGVNSSFILRTLVMGAGRAEINPKRANAYVYSASFDLLRHLGLSKISIYPIMQNIKSWSLIFIRNWGKKDQKQAIEGLNIPADEKPAEQI